MNQASLSSVSWGLMAQLVPNGAECGNATLAKQPILALLTALRTTTVIRAMGRLAVTISSSCVLPTLKEMLWPGMTLQRVAVEWILHLRGLDCLPTSPRKPQVPRGS